MHTATKINFGSCINCFSCASVNWSSTGRCSSTKRANSANAGPAAQAGMRPGDVIVKVGETATRNVSELLTAVASLKPGEAAKFDVRRGDSEVMLDVTPGIRPAASTLQQNGNRRR